MSLTYACIDIKFFMDHGADFVLAKPLNFETMKEEYKRIAIERCHGHNIHTNMKVLPHAV